MIDEKPISNQSLTSLEKERVAKLSEIDLNLIDQMILENSSERWRKQALVIAIVFYSPKSKYHNLPITFLSERVQELVNIGRLESQGNLEYLRFSEIRLSQK